MAHDRLIRCVYWVARFNEWLHFRVQIVQKWAGSASDWKGGITARSQIAHPRVTNPYLLVPAVQPLEVIAHSNNYHLGNVTTQLHDFRCQFRSAEHAITIQHIN